MTSSLTTFYILKGPSSSKSNLTAEARVPSWYANMPIMVFLPSDAGNMARNKIKTKEHLILVILAGQTQRSLDSLK